MKRRPHPLLLLFEKERDLDGMRAFDVNGQVPGRLVRAHVRRRNFGHRECAMGLVEVLLRTGLAAATAKGVPRTSSMFVWTKRRWVMAGCPLDASGPGANRGVTAAVREHHGERVSRARLAVHGDENAASRDERLENPAVVLLETDPAHRVARVPPSPGRAGCPAVRRPSARAARLRRFPRRRGAWRTRRASSAPAPRPPACPSPGWSATPRVIRPVSARRSLWSPTRCPETLRR